MTESTIYWITRLDSIRIAIAMLTFIVCMSTVLAIALKFSEDEKVVTKGVCIALFMSFLCIVLMIFVPSTNEMLMIKAIPYVANTDFVKKDLPKDYHMIIKLCEETLIKIEKENNKHE